VIDLVCYRRRGHNETDEPSSTQPLMYATIKKHKSTRTLYAQTLINDGLISVEGADEMVRDYRASLDRGEYVVNKLVSVPDKKLFVDWSPYLGHDWDAPADTAIELQRLQEIAFKTVKVPEGVVVQRQVEKIYDDRRKMAGGALPINWGMAEMLAYATLLEQGYPVRMTGQDCGRGTFSHRHAVIHNQKDGQSYVPLADLYEGQPRFDIYDSILSEEAVLAFEYGYATTSPHGLVVWEAQFGDFVNGAQVLIDQFITSGEHKWGRLCGLTLLLPHGYEGQGPEHSSARLERFMQLSAEHNIQVCNPTTPAQIFHLLRRQAIRPMRRPLVIMSPKWILRHKLATSSLEELGNGSFRTVIDDGYVEPKKAKRLVFCSGKVYYHLHEERMAREIDDIAIIRIEQLYPFDKASLYEAVKPYTRLKDVVWCQEEPMNQGVWFSSQHRMLQLLNEFNPKIPLHYMGRESSAAPASGYMSVHLEEQNKFINEALTLSD